jgi:hypothetical protein
MHSLNQPEVSEKNTRNPLSRADGPAELNNLSMGVEAFDFWDTSTNSNIFT